MLEGKMNVMPVAGAWILLAIFASTTVFMPVFAFADGSANLSITPVVIDDKAKARDILKKSITIKNTSERLLNVYPAVNDVHPEDGTEVFESAQDMFDRAASLANWIELSRGVIDIAPGEEKVIPFVIRVNLNAEAGTYHARISFAEGSSRSGARPLGDVMVNLEVQQDVKEVMQLNKFITDNVFFSGDDVVFNFQLENIGNQLLDPKGEIRIYNRRGEEIATLDVNTEGRDVAPDQMVQLASVWSAANGFGKFKAFLNVDYGKSQTASIQDTVFFWIIPWKQLLALFVGAIIVAVWFILYSHRWFESHIPALAHIHKHEGSEANDDEEPAHSLPEESAQKLSLLARVMAAPKRFVSRRKSKEAVVAESDTSAMEKALETHKKEQKVVAPQPVTAPPAPQIQHKTRSLRDALEQGPRQAPSQAQPQAHSHAHGETINLKNINHIRASQEGGSHTHNHVINLKKIR